MLVMITNIGIDGGGEDVQVDVEYIRSCTGRISFNGAIEQGSLGFVVLRRIVKLECLSCLVF